MWGDAQLVCTRTNNYFLLQMVIFFYYRIREKKNKQFRASLGQDHP